MSGDSHNRFDAAFIALLQNGDQDAFDMLYSSQFPQLVYFVNSYIKDEDTAQDIVQDVLEKLWVSRENIDPNKSLRAFLFTMARNSALNYLRSLRVRKSASMETAGLDVEIYALEHSSVEEEIEALSLSSMVNEICRNLPDTVRESFILSRFGGYTNKEIARYKGSTEKAVEYHMKISLNIFRKKMKRILFLF